MNEFLRIFNTGEKYVIAVDGKLIPFADEDQDKVALCVWATHFANSQSSLVEFMNWRQQNFNASLPYEIEGAAIRKHQGLSSKTDEWFDIIQPDGAINGLVYFGVKSHREIYRFIPPRYSIIELDRNTLMARIKELESQLEEYREKFNCEAEENVKLKVKIQEITRQADGSLLDISDY